ncbi:protein CHUP1, chloroplastic-like [Asparagus officinalis]|uniref:protein CHUP1, chloroplastic-like n=1 Tax=Asparagus officinalis TaxID=4686 RepID=UPI00098E07D8|nr:protein CHUP1, chloroplastic-like [Asparagus officinalis]
MSPPTTATPTNPTGVNPASEKKGIKPFVVKLGFALALSFAGFLLSHIYYRRCSKRPSVKAEAGGKGLKDELHILRSEEALAKIINGTSTTTTTTTTTTHFIGLSPTSKSSEDDGFLLPEFNDLVFKEFEGTPTNLTPKKGESKGEMAMEQEIAQLKNLVLSLRERERSLELQLLEYYGLQEQEAIMRDLESQVKMNTMESKIFSLKIEALQAENQRLQVQLFDCSRTMNELENARSTVKYLKRKLRTDGEEMNEKMTGLQMKISMLQSRVDLDERDHEAFERKLKRLKELEDEAVNLRMLNSELQQENLELSRKLEKSLLEGQESEALEEVRHLREENNKLTKEMEQLQTDRCSDLEELVYLRWVNACLRYEVRNYQAPPGKTVARDLSKTLSPKSEQKAKQLIVEYAHSDADEKRLHPVDSDIDYYSCSSNYTSKSSSSKSKFLRKLKKLVLGKDAHGGNNKASLLTERSRISCSDSEKRTSFSSYSVDDTIGRVSCNSSSPSITESNGSQSLDIQSERHNFNIDRSYSHQTMSSLVERSTGNHQNDLSYDKSTDSPEKIELKKFAEVLRKT